MNLFRVGMGDDPNIEKKGQFSENGYTVGFGYVDGRPVMEVADSDKVVQE